MNRSRWLALVFLLAGFDGVTDAIEPGPPRVAVDSRPVILAARELLHKFWPALQKDRASYGLTAQDGLDTLSFGEPVELRGIRDDGVRAYQAGSSVSVADLGEATHQWYVPLVAQGVFRALIEVQDLGRGQWQGSGIGWVPLARKWQAITDRWPPVAGSGPVLLIVFSQPGYYMTLPSVRPDNLTPLSALKPDHDGKVPQDFKLEDAATVMKRLKAAMETPSNM